MIAAQWDREFLGRYLGSVSRVLSGTRFQADLAAGVGMEAFDVSLELLDPVDQGPEALRDALPDSQLWPLRIVVLDRVDDAYLADVFVVMDDDRLINVRDLLRESAD